VVGLAAIVIFIIAPFKSDALWPIGIVLAVVGGVLGWFARRSATRPSDGSADSSCSPAPDGHAFGCIAANRVGYSIFTCGTRRI